MSTVEERSRAFEPMIRRNAIVFGGAGALGALSSAGVLLAVAFLPARGDELWIKLAIATFLVFAIFASFGLAAWGVGQGMAVRRLAIARPQDIARMEVGQARSKGISAFALRLYDARGRRAAVNVPSRARAEALANLLRSAGAKG